MSKLILAVSLDLGADLSEAELTSLTEVLLRKLTAESIETIREELEESHRGLTGSVTIDRMEPAVIPDSAPPTVAANI